MTAAAVLTRSQAQRDPTLVYSVLLGVAGYIGVILPVFTGLLALPLGRLSRDFPDRVFWRTMLQPVPLISLSGLIAGGAICFSAALTPNSIHSSVPLWCFAGATCFLIALLGYVLLISKPSYPMATYGKPARRIVARETCSLVRRAYIRFAASTARDRLIGPPWAIVYVLFRKMPALLADYRTRRIPGSALPSMAQSLVTGCVLAVRDALARYRCDPSPPLLSELQLTAHGFRLVPVELGVRPPLANVCGERTRQIIEDIGSVGRRGIHDHDLDLVTTSYGLLADLSTVAMSIQPHYELEQDELVSALREQFSLSVAEGATCSDNRILPSIIRSASAVANNIVAHASKPTHSHVILSAVGFSAVFRAVTLSRVVQQEDSVACWDAIQALEDLGLRLVEKQYRLSSHTIMEVLKQTAQGYMLLTKGAPHRRYPDVLAGRALSGILRIWAADITNWTIWHDSSLSDKAASVVKELGELYITQREDSIEAEALGELTHFGNIQYSKPTGSLFHPSTALSDAFMDASQTADVSLRRLGYAAERPSRFLIDLLESATRNKKLFIAGQLASEVADTTLLYLSVLRQLERSVEPVRDEWPMSRVLANAIHNVSWFSALATWRLADAFVTFLDCAAIGLTDFADQLLRVTWACVFLHGCRPNFDLDAAINNVGSVVTTKGEEVIQDRRSAAVVRLLAFWYTRKLTPESEHASTLISLASKSIRLDRRVMRGQDFYPTGLFNNDWTPRMPMCTCPPDELAAGVTELLDPQELQAFAAGLLNESKS